MVQTLLIRIEWIKCVLLGGNKCPKCGQAGITMNNFLDFEILRKLMLFDYEDQDCTANSLVFRHEDIVGKTVSQTLSMTTPVPTKYMGGG